MCEFVSIAGLFLLIFFCFIKVIDEKAESQDLLTNDWQSLVIFKAAISQKAATTSYSYLHTFSKGKKPLC